jgi:hypothetical protein
MLIERAAWMIANCATFQAVVGVTTAALAFERVPWFWAEVERTPWPRVVIDIDDINRSQGGVKDYSHVVNLEVWFNFEVPEGEYETLRDQANWFTNKVGAIWSEMEALSINDTTGYEGSTWVHPEIVSGAWLGGPDIVRLEDDEIVDPETRLIELNKWTMGLTFEMK